MAKQLELSCPQCTHSNPLNTKTCQKCSWQLVDNLLESTRLANNKDLENNFLHHNLAQKSFCKLLREDEES